MRAFHVLCLFFATLLTLAGVFIAFRIADPGDSTISNVTTTTSKGNNRWEVEGITFLMPSDSTAVSRVSSSSAGSAVISYENSYLKVIIENGQLTINGKHFGGIESGDEVDLREKDKVLVNGREIKPSDK